MCLCSLLSLLALFKTFSKWPFTLYNQSSLSSLISMAISSSKVNSSDGWVDCLSQSNALLRPLGFRLLVCVSVSMSCIWLTTIISLHYLYFPLCLTWDCFVGVDSLSIENFPTEGKWFEIWQWRRPLSILIFPYSSLWWSLKWIWPPPVVLPEPPMALIHYANEKEVAPLSHYVPQWFQV